MINFQLPKNSGKKYKMLKTAYFKAIYDQYTYKMIAKDFLLCTIKDIETNTNILKIFPEPMIDFYVVKEEYRNEITYPLISIPKEKVKRYTCKYRDRDKEMLQVIGLWKEASMLKRSNYKSYLDFLAINLRNNPHLYAADINIEDFYKTDFELQYGTQEVFPLRKGFYDIEVDVSEYTSTFSDPETPINFISYMCAENKTMHVFLLEYNDIPAQKEVKMNPLGFIQEYLMNQEIEDDTKFDIRFFEREVDLIRSFYDTLHQEKNDFLTAWNSPFDNQYIINRAKKLGINPVELMCTQDIPDEFKRLIYIEDPDRNRSTEKYFHRMWDWVDVSSYTMYPDALSLYSNLRKRTQQESYSLYNISNVELGISKVDLSSYGLSIRTGFKVDYKRFLQYSIMDTYLLYLLDQKNGDLENLVNISENTRIAKGVNVSIVIKNTLYLHMMRKGEIIGNTIDYGIWESVTGAVVASPDNTNIKSVPVYGERKTFIFDNCIDLDASSLYPSIIFILNVCKNTIKKKYVYIYRTGDPNNILMNGGEFFEALETIEASIFDLGEKIFNLPSFESMVEKLNKKLEKDPV